MQRHGPRVRRRERGEILRRTALLVAAALAAGPAGAQPQGAPVPEIHFLTWPAATYSHFAETSRYVAEAWEKLGLRVRLDPVAFPNPMLQMWFTEHRFDVVLSSLTGAPHRMEPDFFTNNQFNSANKAPGAANVGEYSNPAFDALGERQLKVYDPEQRRPLIYELQRMIVEEQPDAVLSSVVQVFAVNKNNVEFDPYVESPQGIRANQNQTRMRSKRNQELVRIGWTLEYSVLNPLGGPHHRGNGGRRPALRPPVLDRR